MADTNAINYTFQGFKWSRNATLLLISLIAKNYTSLESGVKKVLFQQIALEINEQLGTNLAFDQVESKWKGLKRTYRRVKETKTQLSWEYYDVVDEILKYDIDINPAVIATSEDNCATGGDTELDFIEYIVEPESSTLRPYCKRCKSTEEIRNDRKVRRESSDENVSGREDRKRRINHEDRNRRLRRKLHCSDDDRSCKEERRRRSGEDSPSGYESRAVYRTRNGRESAEDARERRHQEKMNLAKKFLDIFERMVDKM